MKERGILFTPENYRKSDEGLKTRTRRIMRHQPGPDTMWFAQLHTGGKDDGLWFPMKGDPKDSEGWEQAEGKVVKCEYGEPGDRLYAKEGLEKDGHYVRYRHGDRRRVIMPNGDNPRWEWKNDVLSSMFMPKWAARLWLELTDVQAERLHDISDEDVLAEGVRCRHDVGQSEFDRCDASAQDHFRELWVSINGEDSWDLNPFCWVLSFRKLQWDKSDK